MSTICRLKERQEAKTTLVLQVCVSETCCQNRNWEVARKTWFGGECSCVQQVLGGREIQIRVGGHLDETNCWSPQKQCSHVEENDRPL